MEEITKNLPKSTLKQLPSSSSRYAEGPSSENDLPVVEQKMSEPQENPLPVPRSEWRYVSPQEFHEFRARQNIETKEGELS